MKELEDIDSNLDVAWEAYCMCRDCGSSRDWAEKQIERGIGDVAWTAYLMCSEYGSSREWASQFTKKGD